MGVIPANIFSNDQIRQLAEASVACPALAFDPWHKQQEILECDKEVRLLAWANRTGKSTIGACECVLAGMGVHPYIDYPEPPFTIWAVSNSYKQMQDSIIPAFEGDATHPRMLPYGITLNQTHMCYFLPSGSIIRLKTVEAGRESFQGAAIPLTWLDEDIDPTVLKEIFSRIGTNFVRRILWSITAVNGLTYSYNYLYLPVKEAEEKGLTHPSIHVSIAGMDENPHLSRESIDSILKFFPKGSKEYKVRRYGGFENLSGDSVFPEDTIDKYSKMIKPSNTVNLRWSMDGYNVQWRNERAVLGQDRLSVWQYPHPSHHYAIGADVAEGRLSDTHDADSNRDYSAATVFNRTTRQFVARFHARCDAHTFGYWLWLIGNWYNNAWICPELNHNGTAVLGVLRGTVNLPNSPDLPYYRRIYARETDFDRYSDDISPDLLGWKTTTITRPKMISDFYTLVNSGECYIFDGLMIEEMKSFQRNKLGKAEHTKGFHDDILFSAMLALQADLQCPMETAIVSSHTGTFVENVNNDAVIGERDNFEEEYEYEEMIIG